MPLKFRNDFSYRRCRCACGVDVRRCGLPTGDECATALTAEKVRCSPSSPCSRRCAWRRVALLLPSPSLRSVAWALPGRHGKAGSPIDTLEKDPDQRVSRRRVRECSGQVASQSAASWMCQGRDRCRRRETRALARWCRMMRPPAEVSASIGDLTSQRKAVPMQRLSPRCPGEGSVSVRATAPVRLRRVWV